MVRSPLVVALVLLLAGCLGTPGAEPGTGLTATETATPGSTPVGCSTDADRVDLGIEASDLPRRNEGFRLATNETNVTSGEGIRFSLRNVARETLMTGTERKYVVQRRSSEEWETVLRWGKNRGWNATAVSHEPGDGFEWPFRASARGFSTNGYLVCEPLSPGEYRFVYFGIAGEATDARGDRAVAVRFHLGDG